MLKSNQKTYSEIIRQENLAKKINKGIIKNPPNIINLKPKIDNKSIFSLL